MARKLGDRRLQNLRVLDDGVVACPFSFVINGTSAPDGVLGDIVSGRTVTYATGKFTFTMANLPYSVLAAHGNHQGGDATDFTVDVDYSAATTTGVITVRTKSGGTLTTPGDDTVVSGVLYCKTTAFRASA
jgi:hypothetical protein